MHDGSVAMWSERAVARYTWVVSVLTLLGAASIVAFGPPDVRTSTVVMVMMVGAIGLPHGAYDLEVARTALAPRLGRWWPAPFVGVYIALVVVAILFWITVPWLALVVLLVGGAVHWGSDDLHASVRRSKIVPYLKVARGAIPVALPLLFHPGRTAEIFAALTGSAIVDPANVQVVGLLAAVLCLPGVVMELMLRWHAGRAAVFRTMGEVVTLAVWFAVAPPLLAFTVYFCLWHSVRHSIRSVAAIRAMPAKRAARRYLGCVAFPTVATWVLAAVVWFVWLDGRFTTDAMWQMVFVGLFALAVPHVLVEFVTDCGQATDARTGASMASIVGAVKGQMVSSDS